MRPKLSFALLLLIAPAMPSGAAASGGPPIPGASYDGTGVTGPPGTAAADYRYVVGFGGNRGTTLAKVSTDDGRIPQFRFFDEAWALPAVTIVGNAGGLSADGSTLVLTDANYRPRSKETRYLLVDTRRLQSEKLTLPGNFSFDAISPDGRLLYLVQYPHLNDPFDYRVRAYDTAKGEFRPGKIVDPEKPDEQMTGQPISRGMSADGRWAYTLYAGGEETFIHALDTQGATAVCVDLPEVERDNIFSLGLRVGADGGPIEVLEGRNVTALVDQETLEVSEPATSAAAESADPAPAGDDGGVSPAVWIIAAGALLALLSWQLARRRRPAV